MLTDTKAQGPLRGVKVLEFVGLGPAPFCAMLLSDLGAEVVLRQGADGEAFRSDEGHWILDCAFGPTITDPPALATTLSALAGVVDHGLFCGMTERVLVGADDGVEEVVAG